MPHFSVIDHISCKRNPCLRTCSQIIQGSCRLCAGRGRWPFNHHLGPINYLVISVVLVVVCSARLSAYPCDGLVFVVGDWLGVGATYGGSRVQGLGFVRSTTEVRCPCPVEHTNLKSCTRVHVLCLRLRCIRLSQTSWASAIFC